MTNIVDFPGEKGGGRGGGPREPTIEERLTALGRRFERFEIALQRLEPVLRDIAGESRAFRKAQTEMQVKLAVVEGRITGLEGRLQGFSDRLQAMPSTFHLVGMLLTTSGAGAALVFTISRLAQP